MIEISQISALGLNHVQVIVKGMFLVAKCDEVHAVEEVLIREFYEGCRQEVDGLAAFEDLVGQPFEMEQAKRVLDTHELQMVFLKSCLFLAFADGVYSDAERQCIDTLYQGLGIDKESFDNAKSEVTDHLLQQIARIQNTDALQEVASELWKE